MAQTATKPRRKPRSMAQKGRRVRLGNARNILAVVQTATPNQVADGVAWYRTFRDDIVRTAQEAGLIVPASAVRRLIGIAAAFSIQRNPHCNLSHVFKFVRDRIRGTERTGCYHSTVQDRKASAIWDGTDPTDALTGPKELAFFLNISGDPDHVTIDGHAFAIWLGRRITTDVIRVPSRGPIREACEADYRAAARSVNLSPSELQAITWLVWRDRHQVNGVTQGQLFNTRFATMR